jgi:hypothetical protein
MRILLMGGGDILVRFSKWLKQKNGLKVAVLASDRHLEEKLSTGVTLESTLNSESVPFYKLEKLTVDELKVLPFDLESVRGISFGSP